MKPTAYIKYRCVKSGREIFDREATLRAIKEKIATIRESIVNESVSYGEIAELQELAGFIDESDNLLLEWAGVPEFSTPKPNKSKKTKGVQYVKI